MADYCTKSRNGTNISICETMQSFVATGSASTQIFEATITTTQERIQRTALITKRTNGKYAMFNFCPFCGANIDTSDYGLKPNNEVQQ